MKVFVTGGTGFIGQYLMRQLLISGHQVLCLSRKKPLFFGEVANLSWLEASISDLESIKQALLTFQPDACVHLAWQDIPDFSFTTSRQNLFQSINLLDIVMEMGCCKKILVSGSCFEYFEPMGSCIESHQVLAKDYFTWAKLSLKDYFSLRCNEKGISWYWPRIFYAYGPKQRQKSLIPYLIKKISNGEDPMVKTPFHANDFIHVSDTASALVHLLIDDAVPGVYNVGSGQSLTVEAMCRMVASLVDKQVEFDFNSGGTISNVNFHADTKKIRKNTKWKPAFSIEQGLHDTTNHFLGVPAIT